MILSATVSQEAGNQWAGQLQQCVDRSWGLMQAQQQHTAHSAPAGSMWLTAGDSCGLQQRCMCTQGSASCCSLDMALATHTSFWYALHGPGQALSDAQAIFVYTTVQNWCLPSLDVICTAGMQIAPRMHACMNERMNE